MFRIFIWPRYADSMAPVGPQPQITTSVDSQLRSDMVVVNSKWLELYNAIFYSKDWSLGLFLPCWSDKALAIRGWSLQVPHILRPTLTLTEIAMRPQRESAYAMRGWDVTEIVIRVIIVYSVPLGWRSELVQSSKCCVYPLNPMLYFSYIRDGASPQSHIVVEMFIS